MTVQELSDEEIAVRLEALRGSGDHEAAAEGGAEPIGGTESTAPLATLLNEAQAGWGAEAASADAKVAAEAARRYRFVRPLTDAADSLIDFFQNSDGRYLLGLREIDLLTRGFGPGELIYLLGYTHSGKTQVALTGVLNNRNKRTIIFTADEPSEMVLTKTVCMLTRSNAERLEERVKAGDSEAINRVRRIAREDLKNLIVVDQSMLRRDMSDAVKEAEDWWGAPVDCVFMDYLELFARAEGCDVEEASQQLKGWAMSHDFPTVCLHQGSRGHSAGGQELKMNSGKYGGEAEAIIQIGVRRQRDNEDLDDFERRRHEHTVSISIIKNKRPPSKRGEHDFFMCPDSGLILPLDSALREQPNVGLAAVRRSQLLSPGQRSFDGEEV